MTIKAPSPIMPEDFVSQRWHVDLDKCRSADGKSARPEDIFNPIFFAGAKYKEGDLIRVTGSDPRGDVDFQVKVMWSLPSGTKVLPYPHCPQAVIDAHNKVQRELYGNGALA